MAGIKNLTVIARSFYQRQSNPRQAYQLCKFDLHSKDYFAPHYDRFMSDAMVSLSNHGGQAFPHAPFDRLRMTPLISYFTCKLIQDFTSRIDVSFDMLLLNRINA